MYRISFLLYSQEPRNPRSYKIAHFKVSADSCMHDAREVYIASHMIVLGEVHKKFVPATAHDALQKSDRLIRLLYYFLSRIVLCTFTGLFFIEFTLS